MSEQIKVVVRFVLLVMLILVLSLFSARIMVCTVLLGIKYDAAALL